MLDSVICYSSFINDQMHWMVSGNKSNISSSYLYRNSEENLGLLNINDVRRQLQLIVLCTSYEIPFDVSELSISHRHIDYYLKYDNDVFLEIIEIVKTMIKKSSPSPIFFNDMKKYSNETKASFTNFLLLDLLALVSKIDDGHIFLNEVKNELTDYVLNKDYYHFVIELIKIINKKMDNFNQLNPTCKFSNQNFA